MKKKIFAAFLAVTSVFMSFSSVMADDAITVIVNNKEVVFEDRQLYRTPRHMKERFFFHRPRQHLNQAPQILRGKELMYVRFQ